jgi:peptidoglycan/xylan/chitin deacetylase (PgdA/CDA1 family)
LSRTRSRGRLTLSLVPAVLLMLLSSCSTDSPASPLPTQAAPQPIATVAPDPTSERPTPSSASSSIVAPIVLKVLGLKKGTGPSGSMLYTGSAGVALTFDDGPDPIYTPIILDMLKANGVKATFCLVGRRARLSPGLIRRIVAEGHTLCNHSTFHDLSLGKYSDVQINSDLQETLDVLHAAVPGAKVKYFRAPGGNYTTALVRDAANLGMRSLYWAVDPRDWDFATYGSGQSMVNHIISVVEGQTRPGSIVLSHDLNKPDTMAAYRVLLPWLKARYQLICMPV